jgi:hypothetical protein
MSTHESSGRLDTVVGRAVPQRLTVGQSAASARRHRGRAVRQHSLVSGCRDAAGWHCPIGWVARGCRGQQ